MRFLISSCIGQLRFVCYFFSLIIFSQFYPLTFGWFGIKLHICFRFLWGYSVLLYRSWVWLVNLSWFSFFELIFFFNFILQYWIDWELNFITYFNLFYIELFQSYDPGYSFDRLTWVVSFLVSFFNWFFYFIF